MTATQTYAGTWNIDPAHSNAEFAIRHMVISTVRGSFDALEGTVTFDPSNPTATSVNASIDVASISTGETQRDDHLRSPDFFDVENFPNITFQSTRVESTPDGNFKLVGNLTIRDVTREITLDARYDGQIKDAYGNQRAGFEATGELNRGDFGLTWNAPLEAGGFVVGDRVNITLNVAAVAAGE